MKGAKAMKGARSMTATRARRATKRSGAPATTKPAGASGTKRGAEAVTEVTATGIARTSGAKLTTSSARDSARGTERKSSDVGKARTARAGSKGLNTAGLAGVRRVARGRDAADLVSSVPKSLGAELRRAQAAGIAVALLVPNAQTRVVLPQALVALVADALDAMSAGRGVALVVQSDALSQGSTDSHPCPYLILDRDPQDELTTQQAAAALRVSRPTIIKAIDDGRLAARKVGKHRRIRVYDFNAFARVDHGESARVASALSRDSHATGDYQSLLPLSDADWTALKPRGVASSA